MKMNGFQRNNKRAGVYWLKKSIQEFQVAIKLLPKNNIVIHQNTTETNEHPGASPQLQPHQDLQEYTFKWQEKVFSKWELLQYTDSFNCSTETEMNYHNLITNHDFQPSIVSTQINEDLYENFSLKGPKLENIVDNLSLCLERVNLNCGLIGRKLNAESTGHLFQSEDNVWDNDLWLSMNIVLDCSDYREQQLLMKREETLLSLHYNPEHLCLIVSPDRNDLESNPYSVSVSTAVPVKYDYAVSFETGMGVSEGLVELLTKLQIKWSRKHKPLLHFTMPPLGKRQTIISLELVSATGFEMDSLYIEYHVKIPESVHCDDPLHGKTHTTKSLSADGQEYWYFGHPIELCCTTDVGVSTPPIKLILEVISTDWWDSHRTEGYTHTSIPLDSGHTSKTLSCMRPEEKNQVEADTRRFFVAGCNLVTDLDVLCEPSNQEPNIRYVPTGSVSLRWSCMSQCHEPRVPAAASHASSSYSSTALLRSAEAVLTQYRKAKARLHAATGGGDAD